MKANKSFMKLKKINVHSNTLMCSCVDFLGDFIYELSIYDDGKTACLSQLL